MTWERAISFAVAGNAKTVDRFRVEPFYILFGHAIELALKSFLFASGFSVEQCQRIGHNLEEAANQALAKGLEISQEDLDIIARLTDAYGWPFELRYLLMGAWSAPPLQNVADCSGRLLASLRNKL